MLEVGDEDILLEFFQWLTPEALELWHFYGKQFDRSKIEKILKDSSTLKIAGIDLAEDLSSQAYKQNERKERIVVFGILYNFKDDSCRLGIVAGVTGKQYGTKMMKVLMNFARSSGCKKIYLSTYQDNYPALALYKKFGFNIIKEFSDRPRKAYEMEWKQ